MLGSGLGALEPFLRDPLKEMRELRAQRDASLAALEAAKGTPGAQKFGQKVSEYFTGEPDLWRANVNQAVDKLRRLRAPFSGRRASIIQGYQSRRAWARHRSTLSSRLAHRIRSAGTQCVCRPLDPRSRPRPSTAFQPAVYTFCMRSVRGGRFMANPHVSQSFRTGVKHRARIGFPQAVVGCRF
jgi:hypothetical protein